jgi:hypothetical protein
MFVRFVVQLPTNISDNNKQQTLHFRPAVVITNFAGLLF